MAINKQVRDAVKVELEKYYNLDLESYRSPATGRVSTTPFKASADGTFTLRVTFFYRHGNSTEKVAANVVEKLEATGFTVEVINAREVWRVWPKDSYWEVRFAAKRVDAHEGA